MHHYFTRNHAATYVRRLLSKIMYNEENNSLLLA